MSAQIAHCPILGKAGVQAIIWSRTGPGWEATNHALAWERVLVVLEGAYDLWLGDRLVRVPAGSLAWQHPGDRVWQRSAPEGEAAYCLINGGDDGIVGRCIANRPSRIVSADTRPIGLLAESFLGEWLRGADPAILDGILTACTRMCARALGGDDIPAVLARAWDQVANDPARPWSITGIARGMRVSTETLRSLTLRHYRRNARAHLSWLRLRHAAELLMDEHISVGSAAARCGYADVFAFSRAFRTRFGVPPSAWATRGNA